MDDLSVQANKQYIGPQTKAATGSQPIKRSSFSTNTLRCLALGIGLIFANGCSETESVFIDTAGIWADFEAISDSDDSIEVTAEFRVGDALSNTYLDLTGGEYVEASIGSDTRIMSENEVFLGVISYKATFNHITNPANTEVTITLHRQDQAAINTTLTIPSDISIDSPTTQDSYYFGNNDIISVIWSPTQLSDDISTSYAASCVSSSNSFSNDIYHSFNYDPGVDSLAVDQLITPYLDANTTVANTRCNVTIDITRSQRSQSVNSQYQGGSVESKLRRSVTILILPSTGA